MGDGVTISASAAANQAGQAAASSSTESTAKTEFAKTLSQEATSGQMAPATSSSTSQTAAPMTKSQARSYANKQASDFRTATNMSGRDVQAGHTAAARHAPESGISRAEWDKAPMQQLHSRKGRGLDVTVTDQNGNVATRTRHTSQEGLIDEGVGRVKAANNGVLTPKGQLDAANEVAWRTANVPMDQRDVNAIRNSSPKNAATAPGPNVSSSSATAPGGAQKSVHMTHLDADVDPATGRVVAGPNTDAALKRRAQLGQKGAAEAVTAQKGLAPKTPAPELPKTASLPQAAQTEQAATTVGQGFKAESTSSQAAKLEQAGAAKAETTAAKVLGGAGKVAGTVVHGVGVYATAGGTYAALKGVGDDIREGNFGSAALGTSAYLGGAGELGAMANVALTGTQSTLLVNGARVLGAPAAVAGAAIAGVKIGTYLNDHYVNKEGSMDAGAWAEAKTGSRVLGGVAAAGYAVGSAAYHAPEAAVDYVKNNVTLNPSEVDWDRTLKPWKWF